MSIASANELFKELEILSTDQRGAVRAPSDCKVVKVLVHEGMKVEKDQPIFVVAVYPKQMRPVPLSESEKSHLKKCIYEWSSLPTGLFPIEDVKPCIVPVHALSPFHKHALLLHQKNAGNSPMEPTFDSTVDLLNSHDNFKKFDYVVDHSDHLFAKHNYLFKHGLYRPTNQWIDQLNEDRRILCGHLPDTMFARMYKSRPDLLRAAIVGPEGTPYHNGLFFFDFCFPDKYPNKPPLVRYHSGGLGINPCLKACGHVSFNLSSTRSSLRDIWVPGTSNMLQVLVYIQDLIFNPSPFFNYGIEEIKDIVDSKPFSQLYNENTIINIFKTMVYIMNKPPKNFETLVASHFLKRARSILLECKDYTDGLQVGSLVSSSKCSSSIEFRNDVASIIHPLVNAFCKIGAKEAQKFLYLSLKKTPLPEYDPISGVDPDSQSLQTFTACCPFLVNTVHVKDGMNVKKGASFLHCAFDPKEFGLALSSSATKAELRIKEILEENQSSRVGIFSMEDVSVDEDDDAEFSPIPVLYNQDCHDEVAKNSPIVNWYQTYDFAFDHTDHFFSSNSSPKDELPIENILAEWTDLKNRLPGTQIFVKVYEDRMDLLRAVIIGPEGTPYHNGLFFFDVCFPSTYPSRPPLVHYRSGGLGINPNLNKSGEVRLSLPKTSGGEEDMWVPGSSSIFRLLVSIQNQFFNSEPLFNDITYTCMKGSLCGEQTSLLYNENVFIKSLKTMVYTMNKPPKYFEDFVVGYFRDHVHDILMSCKKVSHSITFKNDLASCINLLIDAFTKIGAKESEDFKVEYSQIWRFQNDYICL